MWTVNGIKLEIILMIKTAFSRCASMRNKEGFYNKPIFEGPRITNQWLTPSETTWIALGSLSLRCSQTDSAWQLERFMNVFWRRSSLILEANERKRKFWKLLGRLEWSDKWQSMAHTMTYWRRIYLIERISQLWWIILFITLHIISKNTTVNLVVEPSTNYGLARGA
jgi:hypothetical protein